MIRTLETADAVIDMLGGTTAVAKLTGKSPQSVTNWRAADRLPTDTFVLITDALAARNLTAPFALWGMAGADKTDRNSRRSRARL